MRLLLLFLLALPLATLAGPLRFMPNLGQIHDQHGYPRPEVRYTCIQQGMTTHWHDAGFSHQLNRAEAEGGSTLYRIDITWEGGSAPRWQASERLPGVDHYYVHPCASPVEHVPGYGMLEAEGLYPGITMRAGSQGGALKVEYLLRPHADPGQIRLRVQGASPSLDPDGSLRLRSPMGDVVEDAPVALQGEAPVPVRWRVEGDVVSFRVGPYDPARPLLIDPAVRLWGTYYGGANSDEARDVVVRGDRVAISGWGGGAGINIIATVGAPQTFYAGGGHDGFVACFDTNGTRIWGTYIGGSGSDVFYGVDMDAQGNVLAVGVTQSSGSPLVATAGCHQPTFGGVQDVMLVRLRPSGARAWGTYYGGEGYDVAFAVAADLSGNVYLGGESPSTVGIATPGSHQDTFAGGQADGFLAKFDSTGSRQWATYYGATDWDALQSCATDSAGNVYVAGYGTYSASNPFCTPGCHQPNFNGFFADAVLAKFDPSGTRLWGTLYGELGSESRSSVAVLPDGGVAFAGQTDQVALGSPIATVTPGCHQDTFGGNNGTDAFIARFDATGTRIWGTLYGGLGEDEASACATDKLGNILIAGETTTGTNGMPVIATPGSFQTTNSGLSDVFYAKFTLQGTRVWGTFVGGNTPDICGGIDSEDGRRTYAAGATDLSVGLSTPGSHQPLNGGGGNPADCFLLCFIDCAPTADSITARSCLPYTSGLGNTYSATGTYTEHTQNAQGCDSTILIQFTLHQPDTSVLDMGGTLVAQANAATFQWITCPGGQPIPGATQSSFSPSVNGQYAVIVTDSVCSDTSACYLLTDLRHASRFLAQADPNPSTGAVSIRLGQPLEELELLILDAQGRTCLRSTHRAVDQLDILLPSAAGVYVALLRSPEGWACLRLVRAD